MDRSEDKAKHCFARDPDLNPIENKWAQANFLSQRWMENHLKKLFHDMGCISLFEIDHTN
ncbi:MAG TPA: hypothetical protein DCR60_09055 [Psychrobacter sp.]|nr:hypothetical protein [Psychrobacter sp.]|tara:strand:- start:4562 stop:4741 length:180 start_codon:yes stop_codon:yes gene_type:complete